MDRIPIYLGLMLIALAGMTTTIYNAHAWNVGIVKLEPWRSKASTLLAVARAGVGRWLSFFWTHQQLAAATAVLAAMLLLPHAAPFAAVVVLGHTMNVDQLERDLKVAQTAASSLFEKTTQECQAHEVKDSDGKVIATGRVMTEDEKKAVQAKIDAVNAIKGQIAAAKGDQALLDALKATTAGMSSAPANEPARDRRSLGQQFIDSDAMAWLKKSRGIRGSAWTSPTAELHATTLDEGSASGGQLLVSDYRPGILPLLFKRLVIADLLAPGTTDGTSITYMRETTFTNAAAPVSEGGLKPESTLAFDQVSDQVRKIPHWLPVTEEMIEDVPAIRSYVDSRLVLGLDMAEEDQLLNGNGTAPNLTGLLNRSGLTTATVRSGSVTNAEAIFTAMMAVFNASFVMPTGTVLNPTNWQTIQLAKDGNGRYYGMGPFTGPQPPSLWGLPVVVTPSIVLNTGFTGAFNSAAQVFRKGGTRVEVSNSHADFFIRNLLAIRAERRLALCVYRPAAFSKITSLQ